MVYFRPVQNLDIWDLLITPLYLFVLVFLAKRWRDKHYPPAHPLRKYYLKGLYLKFAGAIFIGLIYEYYYNGGDTYNFYYHAKIINSSLKQSPGTWLDLVLHRSPDSNPQMYEYVKSLFWWDDRSSYTVSVIAAVVGLFNGTTYLPIALVFAYIAYTGIWAMFKTFASIYPTLVKPLAIAFLFIPSTIVWGSGVFKDTVCMFALGWLTACTFKVFVNGNLSGRNIFMLLLSFYLIAVIKIYIILSFLPALSLWLLMNYSKKISNITLRWILNIGIIGLISVGAFFAANRYAEELNEYSLENISQKAKKTQDWISFVSETQEGSTYNIGELDGSIGSMIASFPQAVNVTLFRPYLWEARKPIIMLSALEAFAFVIFTIMVIYKRGFMGIFSSIARDSNLLFFLIFTIIFAFAVGISTGNFGSLSRYKIPCMPFFSALLLIVYYQTKPVFVVIKKRRKNVRQQPVSRFA